MVLWDEWQAIGTAVVSLMFVLAGLVYGIGVGFNLPKVKAWARNEFYQTVASAIIFGSIVTLEMLINGVIASIVGPPCDVSFFDIFSLTYKYCAIDIAQAFYLDVALSLTSLMSTLMSISVAIGTLLNANFMLKPFQVGISLAPASFLFPISDLLGIMMTAVSAGAAFLWVQIYLLKFLKTLIALLPIGIAMRAFPFTRGAGAAIIALICGLHILYPLLIVFEKNMVYPDLIDLQKAILGAPLTLGLTFMDLLASLFTLRPPIMSILMFPITVVHYLISQVLNFVIYVVLIVAIFLPVLNLTITFAFMKDFARLLGGEIDVSSLTKLL